MIAAILAAAVVAHVCDGNAMQTATLPAVQQFMHGDAANEASVEVDGGWARVRELQRLIPALRAKAMQVRDPCARQAYLGWVDYYAYELPTAIAQLRQDETVRHLTVEKLP